VDLELVGQTLADRYLVEERIGSGAMGEVYRARHIKVGRSFAVKVLHPELLADPKVRLRFDREAELAGTLKHPHIVGVVDIGETPEGLRYMVMEHAVGEPLSMVIARGPMTAARAIPILRQCSDALNHAHDRGLVHRDLKPDNIIVERRIDGTDYVKIIDLGIAILRDDLSEASSATKQRITTAGVLLGTPQYLAPEQAFGSGDHRIDLFALGIIAYEMLSGRLPFDGEGAEVARANLVRETPPMGVRVPFLDVDPLLEALTLQLMAKKPEQRPQTGKAVCTLLDLIETDRTAAANALGVDIAIARDAVESRPLVRTAESSRLQSENDLAIAVERRPTAESVPLPPLEASTVRAQSWAMPPRRARRGLVIGGTAAAAVAIGALAIGFSSSNKTDSLATVTAAPTPGTPTTQTPGTQPPAGSSTQPPTTQTPGTQPTTQDPTTGSQTQPPTAGSSTQTPTPTQTQTPSPQTPSTQTTKPPPTKPTTTKPTTTKPATTKPTIPKPPPANAPDPTPNELAALYIAVGRDLKAYADKKGAKAEALSHRYRLIKISDSMAAADRRRAAANELWSIRVAAR
jgi:serine/threonine-protein kinase